MNKFKVYVSASTQYANIGVGQYGTEQDRMMQLADIVKYYLDQQNGQFEVYRNKPGWSLVQTKNDANKNECDLFIDNHTNAGKSSAEGTITFWHGPNKTKAYQMAKILYEYTSVLSPGKDRGIKDDHTLYSIGLYILRETKMPAVLTEHIFHTNANEVTYFIANTNKFAKAEAQAICKYFEIAFIDPDQLPAKDDPIDQLVNEMMHDGLITDYKVWYDALAGKQPVNTEWLKILLTRATDKI